MRLARFFSGLSLAASAIVSMFLAGCAQDREARAAAAPVDTIEAVRAAATPLRGGTGDYDPLMRAAGEARFVLLGESTHGTHEYYRERARISERLIREGGFTAVVFEADHPSMSRVNRYVRGQGSDRTAAQALSSFEAFPRWMWRNAEIAAFAERVRTWNLAQPVERRVGFYGIDVYNFFEAADQVVAYLDTADREAAARARAEYRCFAPYRRDPSAYGAAAQSRGRSCQEEAAAVATEVRRLPRPADASAAEALFDAARNATVVAGGEEYFRASHAGEISWNARDQRMAQALDDVARHTGDAKGTGKLIVWAHNTHVGDARATAMTRRGELNLGQLARARYGAQALLVGFLTHGGEVMAAPEWDRPGRVYQVRAAIAGSYAALLRTLNLGDALVVLRGAPAAAAALAKPRLQRAIGVVYVPAMERQAHYFEARLAEQFDAVVYIGQSRPVTPLT